MFLKGSSGPHWEGSLWADTWRRWGNERGPKQWFSNFSRYHLEGLLKLQLQPHAQHWWFTRSGGGPRTSASNESSQVRLWLLIWGHLENHWSGEQWGSQSGRSSVGGGRRGRSQRRCETEQQGFADHSKELAVGWVKREPLEGSKQRKTWLHVTRISQATVFRVG